MAENLSGSTTALFVVKLSQAVAEPVTVSWKTEDGTARAGFDYVPAAGSFVFEPGETQKGIEVVVLGREDGSTGDGLTFYVRVKPPINAVLLEELSECRITVETDEGVTTTSVVVATGPRGKRGFPGASTYELAKQQGYQGSLSDWLGAAGVQAVAEASQAAADAKEQLGRALRFAPGKTVPELLPIENMEGQILVVRGGRVVGMTADGATAQGLTVALAKNTGSQMVGHLDKTDGTNKTVGEALDTMADRVVSTLRMAGSFKTGAQNLKDATQLVWNDDTATYFYWTGQYPKSVPADSTVDTAGGAGIGKWMAVGPDVLRAALAHPTGFSQIGSFDSFDSLRATQPAYDNQVVELKGYRAGSVAGGGRFVGRVYKLADDGGMVAANGGNWHWKRLKDVSDLTILDFGAYMDGKTDDMFAVRAMYYATKGTGSLLANPVGIRFPAGEVALSGTLDMSAETEQPMFRMKGPDVHYGVSPLTRVYLLDKTSTTPLFQVNARRMDVSGLHIWENPGVSNVKPFFKNVCGRGEYTHITYMRVNNVQGLVFDAYDTIDTKIHECYVYAVGGGFFRTGWTNGNPGVWDHSTAVEISNCNFSDGKNKEVLIMMRCTQSIMRNVWFSNNEWLFDISQGDWLFDTVIIENTTKGAAKTKWAKIGQINCRFAQGFGLDETASLYDPTMDAGKAIPSWVTNVMDQGSYDLNIAGSRFRSGLARNFDFSETILQNGGGSENWFEVGTLHMQERGRSARMRLLGTHNWDNAAGDLLQPGATAFGGGLAEIMIECKSTAETYDGTEVTWHGQGSCPVIDVAYKRSYSDITIFVKMPTYTVAAAVFVETNGMARVQTGYPFYLTMTKSLVSDINAVSGLKKAKARVAFNKGIFDGNGFGMDMDTGELVVYTDKRKQTATGVTYIPVEINGQRLWLTATPEGQLPA